MPRNISGLKGLSIALSFSLLAILTLAVFARQPVEKTPAKQEKETKKAPTALLEITTKEPGSFHVSPTYLRRYSHVSPSLKIKRSPETESNETYSSVLDLVKQEEKQRIDALRRMMETNLNPPVSPPVPTPEKENK